MNFVKHGHTRKKTTRKMLRKYDIECVRVVR